MDISYFFLETLVGKGIFSLIISFIFILILIIIARPNIVISPNICYMKDKQDDCYYYVFKIVNKTWFNPVYNVDFQLESLTSEMVNNGTKINYRLRKLDLNVNKRNRIKSYNPFANDGECAFLIRTKEDIKTIIENDDVRLSLTVLSRHGFSNLTKVKKREFADAKCISEGGHFKYGKHLDVFN